jgi:hypothetical protein
MINALWMSKRSLAGSAIVSVIVCRGWRLSRDREVQSSMVDRYRAFVGGCRKEKEGVDWLRVCVEDGLTGEMLSHHTLTFLQV